MRHSLSNLLQPTAAVGDRPIGLFGKLGSLSAGHLPAPSGSAPLQSPLLKARPGKSSLGSLGAFNRLNSSNSSAGSAGSADSATSSQLSSRLGSEPLDRLALDEVGIGGDCAADELSSAADRLDEIFNYCHPRNTILVKLRRSVRGFGIALCGGWLDADEPAVETAAAASGSEHLQRPAFDRLDASAAFDRLAPTPPPPPFRQLIRVKRLYPAQPAAESGLIDEDDILLEANGTCFVGLTSIVRTSLPRTLYSLPLLPPFV